jgi:hypothetical protein
VEDGRTGGEAAEALGITAHRLKALGVIDKIVNEPVGGAHRDMPWMAAQLKRAWPTPAPDRRPQAQGTAAAPLRAPACLRALHRHQGALRRCGHAVWPWPPAAGAIPPRLLHCTLRQARALGIEVLALHVHHGLLPQADAWLAQVRAQSRRWGAGFDAAGACSGAPPRARASRPGRGPGATGPGRDGPCGRLRLVLLAHHRRDQAETWLLQALRGAGPAGLSAMPAVTEAVREGMTWARPGWTSRPKPSRPMCAATASVTSRTAATRPPLRAQPAAPAGLAGAVAGLCRCRKCLPAAAAHAQEAALACRSGRAGPAGVAMTARACALPGWPCRQARRRNVLAGLAAPPGCGLPACRRAWCGACCWNCRRSIRPLAGTAQGELRLHRGALAAVHAWRSERHRRKCRLSCREPWT